MAAPTSQQLLDAINSGILTICEGGQEYQYPNGTRVKRAEIDALIKAKRELEMDAVGGGDSQTPVIFNDPVGFGRVGG